MFDIEQTNAQKVEQIFWLFFHKTLKTMHDMFLFVSTQKEQHLTKYRK